MQLHATIDDTASNRFGVTSKTARFQMFHHESEGVVYDLVESGGQICDLTEVRVSDTGQYRFQLLKAYQKLYI